jgi:hypothetical protein
LNYYKIIAEKLHKSLVGIEQKNKPEIYCAVVHTGLEKERHV